MPIALGDWFSLDQTQLIDAPEAAGVIEDKTRVAILGAGLARLTCASRFAEWDVLRVSPNEMRVLEREL